MIAHRILARNTIDELMELRLREKKGEQEGFVEAVLEYRRQRYGFGPLPHTVTALPTELSHLLKEAA